MAIGVGDIFYKVHITVELYLKVKRHRFQGAFDSLSINHLGLDLSNLSHRKTISYLNTNAAYVNFITKQSHNE